MTAPAPAVNESISRRLVRSAGWITLGNVSSRILSLLTGVLAARLLSENDFGAFGLIQSTVSTFGILATMSLATGATRELAVHRDSVEKRAVAASVALALSSMLTICASVLLFFLSPLLAQHMLRDEKLAAPLRLGVLLLGMTALSSVLTGILSGMELFNRTAVMAGLQNLSILVTCILLVPSYRLYGLLSAYGIGFAASVISGLWFARRLLSNTTWPLLRKHATEEARILIRFCLPNVACGLMVMAAFWGASVLIVRGPDGYRELAHFTAADRFRQMIFFVAGFIGTALLPLISNVASSRREIEEHHAAVELGIRCTALLVVPAIAILAFGGPQFMSLFGHSYAANWSVLLPVLIWAGISAITGSASTALLAYNKVAYFFWQQTAYASMTLLLTAAFSSFGAIGLAWAFAFAIILTTATNYFLSVRVGIFSARARNAYVTSSVAVVLVCTASWSMPANLRPLLALPIAAVIALMSLIAWSTVRERSAMFSWIKTTALTSRPKHG